MPVNCRGECRRSFDNSARRPTSTRPVNPTAVADLRVKASLSRLGAFFLCRPVGLALYRRHEMIEDFFLWRELLEKTGSCP